MKLTPNGKKLCEITNYRIFQKKKHPTTFESTFSKIMHTLIFGGYVSVITELTTGYANYKYYKEPKRKSKPFAVNYDTTYR